MTCWDHLSIHFSLNFVSHPNLLNCNKDNVKTLLLPPQAFHLGIENQLKFIFFQDAIQDPIFYHFIRFCPKIRFGDPLQNPVGCKMAPKITQVAPKGSQKASDALTFSRSWNRLASKRSPEAPEGSFCMICCAFWDPLGLSFTGLGNNSGTVSCITC